MAPTKNLAARDARLARLRAGLRAEFNWPDQGGCTSVAVSKYLLVLPGIITTCLVGTLVPNNTTRS